MPFDKDDDNCELLLKISSVTHPSWDGADRLEMPRRRVKDEDEACDGVTHT